MRTLVAVLLAAALALLPVGAAAAQTLEGELARGMLRDYSDAAWRAANVREEARATLLAKQVVERDFINGNYRAVTRTAPGTSLVPYRGTTAVAAGPARVTSATYVARGARVLGGPVGIGIAGAQLVYATYQWAHPPADWDWESGEDPEITAPTGPEQWVHTIVRDEPLGRLAEANATFEWRTDLGAFGEQCGFYMTAPSSNWRFGGGGFAWRAAGSSDAWTTTNTFATFDVFPAQPVTRVMSGTCVPEREYRMTGVYTYISEPQYQEVRITWEQTGGNRARIGWDRDCGDGTSGPVTTHGPSYTEWYDDHDERPDLPAIECAVTERLVGYSIWRELEDGSRRYIVGGPVDEDGPHGYQPGSVEPSTTVHFAPVSRTGTFSPEEQDALDDCDDPFGPGCAVELRRVSDDQRATPIIDGGWQYDPDREDRYYCVVMGAVDVVTSLEECAGLQWDDLQGRPRAPTQEAAPAPSPTPDPESADYPDPDLDEPTETGEPPTAPLPDVGCIAGRQESGGFSSWIVFVGVACALEWAFVPQQTATQLDLLQQEASTRPPFSALPLGWAIYEGWSEGWETDCGLLLSFWPFEGSSDNLGRTVSFDPRGTMPCAPPDSVWWQSLYALTSGALVVGGVLSVFLLSHRALKGPD